MADRQYRYAQIIIDISHEKLDRPFTYRIPAALADQVEPGSRVRIPFGHAVRTGYVVELTDSCDLPEDKIREIGEVLLPGQGYSREKDSGFYQNQAADPPAAGPGCRRGKAGFLPSETSGGQGTSAAGADRDACPAL